MASTPNDLVIRPVCLQDAHALWTIAREQGVIETTLALPSLRLEQERTISMAKVWFITGTSTGLGRTLAEEAVLPIMREQRSGYIVQISTAGGQLSTPGLSIYHASKWGIGRLRLVGNKQQQIEAFPEKQIKRVRIVQRADGYYCQFSVQVERTVEHISSGKHVGIDVGLKAFYTDSEGNTVDTPRHYRKAEKKLKRLHRHVSRKQKKSKNRKKERSHLAKAYLKVQRQREDFARKRANTLVTSNDLIAYENLQIRNMAKNHHLAKSIHDAGWGQFIRWVNYYGTLHEISVIAVAPQYTSQDCSACGTVVKKSLSVRTHICPGCGIVLDRDHNAALNILAKALDGTLGHRGTHERVS